MDLNTTWFVLYAVLLIGYALLDGFDLGVGVLHLFARDEHERRLHLNAIGPVWDGNEVWLLTAGGALFAAFPPVYATVFSGFYLPLMLVLAALIARAVSLEFRGKVDSPLWRRAWDLSFGLGSLTALLLFGVAVGNIVRGIAVDAAGNYVGGFFALLNPYALLSGVATVAIFVMHGVLWLRLKTDGPLAQRMGRTATRMWMVLMLLYLAITVATFFAAPRIFARALDRPLFWVFFLTMMTGIFIMPPAISAARNKLAFLGSALATTGIIAATAVCMFPVLVPSSLDPAFSLDIYNASSTQRTLGVMLIIAGIGMPLVIGYTSWIYWTFRGKVELDEHSY